VLITGPTGLGKTWLGCVLVTQARRHGLSVSYFRTSRLLESLSITHGYGRLSKLIQQLAKTDISTDDTLSYAVLDKLLHNKYKTKLKAESMKMNTQPVKFHSHTLAGSGAHPEPEWVFTFAIIRNFRLSLSQIYASSI